MLDSLPVLIMWIDSSKKLKWANRSALEFIQKNMEEILDRSPGAAISCSHQNDSEEKCGHGAHCLNCSLRHVLDDTINGKKNQKKVKVELELNGKIKRQMAGLLSTRLISNSNGELTQLCFEDVSLLEFAQDQMKEERYKFFKSIQGFPIPLAVLDKNLNLENANNSFEIFFQSKFQELIGKSFINVINPAEPEILNEKLGLFKTNGQKQLNLLEQIILDTKKSLWVIINILKLGGLDGNSKSYLLLLNDISCTGRMLEDSRKLRNQIRQAQKVEIIGLLTEGIAHDFNNILGGIMGYSEILLENNSMDDKSKIKLDRIIECTERGRDLTTQLLNYTRKSDSEKRPLDIHKLLKDVFSIVRRTFNKGIDVSLDLKAINVNIMGDAGQLKGAFLNLCIYARDSMNNSGSLIIRSANEELNGVLAISFCSTDYGFESAVRPKIFELFYGKLDLGKNISFGLSSVWTCVNEHGGTIELESNSKTGVIPILKFPCIPAAPKKLSKTTSPISLAGGKVMVVEDDKAILENLQLYLTNLKYSPIGFKDPREGIDYYSKNWPFISFILIDINMPHISGINCLKELKNINPDCLSILMTGNIYDEKIQNIESLGITQLLQKPFRFGHLAQVIENLEKNGIKK